MKVLHLSCSDSGGAGRAAYRIHRALRGLSIDSTMWANHSLTNDWSVEMPLNTVEKFMARSAPHFAKLITKRLKTKNKIVHSPAIFPSQWLKYINNSDFDLIHMHWVGHEMLSIADIARINKPLVWTLHDMWAFCGAEHVSFDKRWREGYLSNKNRPEHESGFDLNRWTWERKKKHWKYPIQIVAPSRWLATCVQESSLMQGWPVCVIPNCLDTECWKPISRNFARELLGIPKDILLIMFGANGVGANISYNKGFDLLVESLGHLKGKVKNIELLVFGQSEPRSPLNLGFPIRYGGHLYDDLSLRVLYSAADVLVVPSRSEAFCQTASEAHACGTPVVAFNIGGLKDVVAHKKTGYLAIPFQPEDLASGIRWTLDNNLGVPARQRAVNLFSSAKVANQYLECYQEIL